jgi:PAS domain S-box-containing protein
MRDITERKQVEADLRQFKAISDRAGYGTAITDLKGTFLYVNEAFARMHGYGREDLVGQNRALLHTDEQWKRMAGLQERLQRDGNYVVEEVWHQRRDGTVFPVLMNGTLVRGEDEAPLFVAATAVDITERKQAEADLVRLSTAVKMSRDSIVISDLEGTILEVNDASVPLFGAKNKRELIGTSAFDLLAPDARDKALAQMRETRTRGYVKGVEYHVITLNGAIIPVEVSATVMMDAAGQPTGYVAISRDITERKHREDEMRRRLMRYHLDDGTLYLVKERVPALSREAFNDLLTAGYRGYVVTRTPEAEFRQGVMGPFTYRWLAVRDSATAIPPTVEALTRLAES